MSETSDPVTVTTAIAIANNTEEHDSSSSYHTVSKSIRFSSDASLPDGEVTHKGKDLVSSRKEKLSKESKKQAMGDIRNSDDPTKSVTELAVPHIINDDVNNQKLSKTLKTDAKSFENKEMQTIRQGDEGRRRSGVFYAGRGRRGSINCGSRSTTYISHGYWRPHPAGAYNSNNSRRSIPGTKNNRTVKTARTTGSATVIDNVENGNQRSATTESSKSTNSHANSASYRSQVTRTFHNGALRANRARRSNVIKRSQSETVAPEFTSQTATAEDAIKSGNVLHESSSDGSGNDVNDGCGGDNGDGDSNGANGDTYYSASNTFSSDKCSNLPIIYVAPTGTISILLNKGVAVEVAVDRAIRILCHDKFSAVCNSRGTGSCILHKKARIFQQNENVFCNFGATLTANEKAAVFGTQGVLFTMSHLSEAYLVSSTIIKGALSVSLGRLQFPSLDYDFTVRMFFTESQNGDQFTKLCNEIVQGARYGKRDDGTLTLTINGVYIKQDQRGDVEVNCRPKHISCSPTDGIVHVRTNMIDMAVQEDDKAFVKRGLKRVHVSRSGMVVSDGNCITSMDHFGHIISSA